MNREYHQLALPRLSAHGYATDQKTVDGSAATTSAALLVVDMPPPLRAEAHRIKSMLIVACERVVVAVAMGNAGDGKREHASYE